MLKRISFASPLSFSLRVSTLVIASTLAVLLANASEFAQSAPESANNSAIASLLKQKVMLLEDQIAVERQKTEENAARLSKLMAERDDYYQKQDGIGISKESFADVLKTLQSQRVQLMIDLAGMDARSESLMKIQEQQVVEKLDSSVLELYTKLIDFHQKKRDQAKSMAGSGSIPKAELRNAEIEYLNAQLQLANAKRSVKVSPKINEELLNVSLDRAEKKARLTKTEALLDSFIESRTTLQRSDDINEEIMNSKRRQTLLKANLDSLDSKLKAAKREVEQVLKSEF